jgi:hypothetical protein
MGVNKRMSKQRLKPFKEFLPERLRGTRQGRALRALSEETLEGTINGASAIVIDSTSTDDECTEAINVFAEDMRNMRGGRIVAIAVFRTDFTEESVQSSFTMSPAHSFSWRVFDGARLVKKAPRKPIPC